MFLSLLHNELLSKSRKTKPRKKYIETINLEIQNVEQGCEYDGVCLCAGDHYDNHTDTVKPTPLPSFDN